MDTSCLNHPNNYPTVDIAICIKNAALTITKRPEGDICVVDDGTLQNLSKPIKIDFAIHVFGITEEERKLWFSINIVCVFWMFLLIRKALLNERYGILVNDVLLTYLDCTKSIKHIRGLKTPLCSMPYEWNIIVGNLVFCSDAYRGTIFRCFDQTMPDASVCKVELFQTAYPEISRIEELGNKSDTSLIGSSRPHLARSVRVRQELVRVTMHRRRIPYRENPLLAMLVLTNYLQSSESADVFVKISLEKAHGPVVDYQNNLLAKKRVGKSASFVITKAQYNRVKRKQDSHFLAAHYSPHCTVNRLCMEIIYVL